MTRRLKLMTSLSTLAAISALTLAGCGGEGESAESEAGLGSIDGEAEAEGGEGESEGASSGGDPASDDAAAYIHLLGLTRGHLIAFYELYRDGATDMSMSHAKHPSSELYAAMASAFSARGQAGFADELTRLADAAMAGGNVDEEFNNVIAAIDAHMPNASPATILLGVSAIVRTAADEFAIGVGDEGAITNAHEYQDAYGFLTASREILSSIQTTDVDETEAIAVAHEQIEAGLAIFNGLTVQSTEGSPSTLYGAAARIEIAARGLASD